jgi:hypothetical protein
VAVEDRTPEQKAADDALDTAIHTCLDAYGCLTVESDPEEGGTYPLATVNWIVLVEQRGFDQDGDSRTTLAHVYRDGDMPEIARIGLLRAALLRAEREWAGPI